MEVRKSTALVETEMYMRLIYKAGITVFIQPENIAKFIEKKDDAVNFDNV